MASDNPIIIEPNNNGFGGFNPAGLGSGFIGGLILGSIWNGNGFGFGGGGNGAAAAAAMGAGTELANAIEHVGDAVNQGTISQLQSAQGITNAVTSGQMATTNALNSSTFALNNAVNNSTLGTLNAINSASDGITAAINATGAGTAAAINQNTLSGMQNTCMLSDKLCHSTHDLSAQIDATGDQTVAAINGAAMQALQTAQGLSDRLCAINNNITNQGYENRLQAQALASQLQAQHAQLMAANDMQHCQDRELMREIASQAVRDKLAEAQADIASKNAQINLQQQLQSQTLYLISQLAPAAAAARTASGTGA